ncbi:hypothetical protein E4U53_004719 [Claviceps sorghi]|nr:hypothetical protein E4U53_004719 [Claviceps sorghi]
MPADLMEKIKKSFSNDARPEIPLACPSPRPPSTAPQDIRHPRTHVSSRPSDVPCPNHDVRDAAHSPPSVLSRHLGPPVVEHKYPHDSKWRRHTVSAQEQYFTR